MIVPVRCFSCGKVVGDYYEDFEKLVQSGKSPHEALDQLGIERYCCRRMILSHVNLIDDVMKYK